MQIAYIEIRRALEAALAARGLATAGVQLLPIEPPRAWGVATNVCFTLAGKAAAEDIARETAGLSKGEAKQRAGELTRAAGERLAREIAAEISPVGPAGARMNAIPFVREIAAEGAYINFYYDTDVLARHVVDRAVAAGTDFGKGAPTGRRIMVEYAQPNTHKDFHVGHLRNASIGQAIANLLEHAGNEVLKATYIGDVGKHVASTVAVMDLDIIRCAAWYDHLGVCTDNVLMDLPGDFEDNPYSEDSSNKWVIFTKNLERASELLDDLIAYVEGKGPFPDYDPLSKYQASDSFLPSIYNKNWVIDDTLCQSELDSYVKRIGKTYEAVTFINQLTSAIQGGIDSFEIKAGAWTSRPALFKAFKRLYITVFKLQNLIDTRINRWLQNWENGESTERIQWKVSRDKFVDYFVHLFSELYITFNDSCWFFESTVEDTKLGQKTAEELKQLGIATIDEEGEYKGALYVDFAKQADAARPTGEPVFSDAEKKRIRQLGKMTILRSDGTSLYQTKELGLAKYKFDNFAIDESLYVVGAEQKLYFEQVFAILRLWGFPNAEHCKHISYELVVLPSGKMSSREGNIVSYRELRDEAVRRALAITQEKGIAGDAADTAQKVAIAAIKYAMLQVTGSQQITFDFEQALSFDGRSAPYLQYAYARTRTLVEGMEGCAHSQPSSSPVGRTAVSASDSGLTKYRRRLPHWRLPGSVYFVTWRLAPDQPALPEAARGIVQEALRHYAGERYRLYAWVVMDDHVHVLVQPLAELILEEQVRRWKSLTANRLQRECGYSGHVWLDEYLDRIQRNENECWETAQNIVDNPQKRWPEAEDYPWMGWDFEESCELNKEADTAVRPTEEEEEEEEEKEIEEEEEEVEEEGKATADTAVRPTETLHPSEAALARFIARFPGVVQDAAARYEPAALCTYLYDMAALFADFYRDCRVLDAPEPQRTFRRRLVLAFRNLMAAGFKLLALPLPEEM